MVYKGTFEEHVVQISEQDRLGQECLKEVILYHFNDHLLVFLRGKCGEANVQREKYNHEKE